MRAGISQKRRHNGLTDYTEHSISVARRTQIKRRRKLVLVKPVNVKKKRSLTTPKVEEDVGEEKLSATWFEKPLGSASSLRGDLSYASPRRQIC